MTASDDTPEEWHRDVVETAPVPVAVYDADRTIRYVNEAMVEFIGTADRNALVGQGAVEIVHPDDREAIDDRIERVLDERESVFESGYTTEDGGTGFGLTIVERIAEAHGWTVEVAEADGGGARFEITGVERPR